MKKCKGLADYLATV